RPYGARAGFVGTASLATAYDRRIGGSQELRYSKTWLPDGVSSNPLTRPPSRPTVVQRPTNSEKRLGKFDDEEILCALPCCYCLWLPCWRSRPAHLRCGLRELGLQRRRVWISSSSGLKYSPFSWPSATAIPVVSRATARARRCDCRNCRRAPRRGT